MIWTSGLAGGVLVLALIGGFFWLNRLFEAPEAEPVVSLAGALGDSRVMTVFAHPDDEQLVNGLITAAKAEGAYVAQVTATRGEAGTQVPVVARQRDLGAVRMAEVLKNGFALGIDEQEVWDYPDGGLPDVPVEVLVARVMEAMSRYQPDLVVTFWPASGATGHKDHMRMGLVAGRAIARLRAGAGAYRGPRHIAYALTPARAMRTLGGETGRFVADNQPAPSHSVPGNVSSKVKGWDIHASQGGYVRRTYGVPARLLYFVWDKEFYAVRDVADEPGDE